MRKTILGVLANVCLIAVASLTVVSCAPQVEHDIISAADVPDLVEESPELEGLQQMQQQVARGIVPDYEKTTQVTVLMYHHLAPEPDPKDYGLVIDPVEFAAQMACIKASGYYTPSLQELADFINKDAPLPAKSVVITFDDGYESNYTYAFPVLQEYGLRAVIFPIGNLIRLDGATAAGWHSYLTDVQMQEMQASGLIEFGSHTYAMHDYRQDKPLLELESTEKIIADLERGEALFAKIDLPRSLAIAYPFGRYGQKAIAACEQMNYQLAFTTKPGRVSRDSSLLELPRMRASGGLSKDEFAKLINYACARTQR